jgi:hypothetical protein
VPDVPLVARLHALGLLPEATRRRFARTVADLAVEIPDPGFLTVTSVRAVLTDTERTAILERVRTEVLGDLGQLLDTWKYDYDYDPDRESPADYLYPLREALQAYAEAFSDAATRSAFDRAIRGVDRLTEELEHRHMTDHVEREQQPRLSSAPSIQTSPTQRSIFEDVDTYNSSTRWPTELTRSCSAGLTRSGRRTPRRRGALEVIAAVANRHPEPRFVLTSRPRELLWVTQATWFASPL